MGKKRKNQKDLNTRNHSLCNFFNDFNDIIVYFPIELIYYLFVFIRNSTITQILSKILINFLK